MASNPAVTEETLPVASINTGGNHTEIVEVNTTIKTGSFRSALPLQESVRVRTLKTIFGSIKVVNITCEVRQEHLIGTEDYNVLPSGHIFVALIPSGKNTDAATGTSVDKIATVPNKQSFPLSSTAQSSRVYNFNLAGFETDLAMDARKQQAVVLWAGNSGVRKNKSATAELPVCSITWRASVVCTGASTLW